MLFYIKEENFVFVKGGEEVYENILFELVINFLLYFVRIVKIFILILYVFFFSVYDIVYNLFDLFVVFFII